MSPMVSGAKEKQMHLPTVEVFWHLEIKLIASIRKNFFLFMEA